jgi:2-polyprenyl-3-methyl-5-hydroxy-6-metoxy-1,4-benzoquinol methylase
MQNEATPNSPIFAGGPPITEGDSYVYSDVIRDDILRMIPADGRVIGSVGCGYAKSEETLVLLGREVHGVDISPRAIEPASTRLTSARVVSPEERIPFEPDSLDGLILADVIEHMPQAWDYLACFARMVKPGGWVVISVPNMRYVSALATFVLGSEWPEDPLGIFDGTHLQVMTHRRLNRWALQAGLELQRWHDKYDHRFVRRNACRLVNRMTFGFLRSFLTYQVQGVFRRTTTSGIVKPSPKYSLGTSGQRQSCANTA